VVSKNSLCFAPEFLHNCLCITSNKQSKYWTKQWTDQFYCGNKHLNSVNKKVHPFPMHVCTTFRLSSKHVSITERIEVWTCLYKQQVLIVSSAIHASVPLLPAHSVQ
jgi:hypothetical protein